MNRYVRLATISTFLLAFACSRGDVALPTNEELPTPQILAITQTSQEPEPTVTVETGEEPGEPYPTNTGGFILGVGGNQQEMMERLRLLAPQDVEKELALYQAEIQRAGMNLADFEFVPNLLEGCSWVITPQNTQTDNFWIPQLTNPDGSPGLIIASLHLFDYVDREVNDDFFDLAELEMPGTQRLVADESCWHVIAGFDQEGELISWYQANEDIVRELPRAAATRITEALAAVGVETRLDANPNGDLTLVHTTSRGDTEIGVFIQQGSELVFEVVKPNGKTASIPSDRLTVDPQTEYLLMLDEEGNTLFAYLHQVQKLNQYQDEPYLTAQAGRLTIVIGDSFDRNDGYGYSSLTVGYRDTSTPGFDPMLVRDFRDPGTGRTVTLDSEGRLSLATEIAQVITAQAWDPTYTFTDLREGKPHQVRTLDGEIQTCDPNMGLAFHTTGVEPPGEFYSPSAATAQALPKFWWECDKKGTLVVQISVDTESVYANPWNVDAVFRAGLLTMAIHQHTDSSNVRFLDPFGSDSSRHILPSSTHLSLVRLVTDLIHEMDEEKLNQLECRVRPCVVRSYEWAQATNIDLIWADP